MQSDAMLNEKLKGLVFTLLNSSCSFIQNIFHLIPSAIAFRWYQFLKIILNICKAITVRKNSVIKKKNDALVKPMVYKH